MLILPPDHHVHTSFCGHAKGLPRHYAEVAFSRGLSALVFADHIPAPDGYDPQTRMPPDAFPLYQTAVQETQTLWPDQVRFGIEADYYPGCETWLETFLMAHPFDVVLGSVHFIGSWGFDNPAFLDGWRQRPLKKVWADYFDLIRRLADTRWFDAVAHLDLPKKFGHSIPDPLLLELAEPALQAIRRNGLVLEINTSGLRKPIREIYPSPSLLRRARALNIPICFGSDAHRPEEVGEGFVEAVRLAQRCGYNTHAVFQNRRYHMEPLPVLFSGT